MLKTPAAPVVYPKSGDFSKETTINVSVPDGCKAYYAFDREPDVNSTEYEQPISMPVGYHIFNVILVAANGKTSKLLPENTIYNIKRQEKRKWKSALYQLEKSKKNI